MYIRDASEVNTLSRNDVFLTIDRSLVICLHYHLNRLLRRSDPLYCTVYCPVATADCLALKSASEEEQEQHEGTGTGRGAGPPLLVFFLRVTATVHPDRQ